MTNAFNTYIFYIFLKKLTTPFNKWKAFDLGIIDKNGNILKKRSTLKTKEEKDSFTLADLFVLKIKKLIELLPGGKTKTASFIAGLYFVKESFVLPIEKWDENSFIEGFEDFIQIEKLNIITEDVSHKNIFYKYGLDYNEINLIEFREYIKNEPELKEFLKYFVEEIPANSVGGGGIAGLNGDPPIRKRKKDDEF